MAIIPSSSGRNKPTTSSLTACKEFRYKTTSFPKPQHPPTGRPKRQETALPLALLGQTRSSNPFSERGSGTTLPAPPPSHRPSHPAVVLQPRGSRRRRGQVPPDAQPCRPSHLPAAAPRRPRQPMDETAGLGLGSCCCPSGGRSPGC